MSKARALHELLFLRREKRRWNAAARQAQTLSIPALRRLRSRALKLRAILDRVIHSADERLILPALGSNDYPVPLSTDWSWRPALWRAVEPRAHVVSAPSGAALNAELTLHHDCIQSELTARQLRNTDPQDLAPFGLSMDVFAFDGTFLSLVFELPQDAVDGMTKKHLIRLTPNIELEKPIEVIARLNIANGPNTEQIVRDLTLSGPGSMVEFDLAYTHLNENRIEKAWLDLIFEDPQMNRIILRDATFARCPRADF